MHTVFQVLKYLGVDIEPPPTHTHTKLKQKFLCSFLYMQSAAPLHLCPGTVSGLCSSSVTCKEKPEPQKEQR